MLSLLRSWSACGLLALSIWTGCGFESNRAKHAKEAEAERAKFGACLADPLACQEECKVDVAACYRFKDERVQARLAEAQAQADGEGTQEAALGVLDKASKVRVLAEQALVIEGSEPTRRVANSITECSASASHCISMAEASVKTSPVGAHAGLALLLVAKVRPGSNSALIAERSSDVDRALREVAVAQQEAREIQATREQQHLQAVAELRPLEDAKEECHKSEPGCRSKCATDGLYCAALAWVIAETPSRLGEASKIARQACNESGSASACWTSARLGEDLGKREARVQELWNDVASPAQYIALLERRLAALQTQKPSPRTSRTIAQVQALIKERHESRYCPAKTAFLAAATDAELLDKAALSCGDDVAPRGTALTECQRIFVRPCDR